ncbi:MAG: hypothetical protein ABEN55_13370 [Bradymonadaceae bacterium]
MSTAGVGKAREREVVDELEDVGWTAERVPRSVADATPVDDVVCTPQPIEDPHPQRPITRQLQTEGDGLGLGDVYQIEVKYRSDSGFGAATFYREHLEAIGLGGVRPIRWRDGYLSGGVAAFVTYQTYEAGRPEAWEAEDKAPQSATDLLVPEVDGAAVRLARRPWIFLWKMQKEAP